jgi:endonuclease/exonuclease/phosphatase family metal-dependent hydrolase
MLKRLLFLILFIFAYQSSHAAFDTLKVMNYNILNFGGTDTSRAQYFRTIIGSVLPDIFICQEITTRNANRILYRQVFEVIAPGIYDTCTFILGPDTGNLLFFKKSRATFISNTVLPTELRDINEFKMYIPFIQDTVRFFSLHLKASTGASNEQQRGREIDTLRYYTNRLPAGKLFMVAGDFNIYRSGEVAYTKLLQNNAGDDGEFYDQINGMTGTWNNAIYAPYHTQSPRGASFGGLDDRFDLIMPSRACTDTITGKFYWIRSEYKAYGNDGNHYNDSINSQPNTAVSVSVANALHDASDHIPVIAKFGMSNPALPVNLVSFTSSVNVNNVKLNWSTATEENNSGFNIERKSDRSEWQNIAFVRGAGNSNSITSYNYNDKLLQSGSYQYRLKQIDMNGNYKYFNLSSDVNVGVPDKFSLSQNYPNPFNPMTAINYNLSSESFVSLKVYDIMGREVMNLVNEKKPAGYYSVEINASALTSGTYFYRLSAGEFTGIKKMILIK